MGKRQHQKDKLYLTYTEWTTLYGGKKDGPETSNFRRLPFDHCCMSLQPFENPYCDRDGNIFELEAILGFLKKYKINPVTGKALDVKSLIKLNFHKNVKDEYHCPVLYKTLTKQSHIVAVATTGNVFSYEAVEQLNIKTKSWRDLITDEEYQKSDLITLQDPTNLTKFNISTFYHIKNNLRVETEEEIEAKGNPEARLKTVSKETRDILDELNRAYKAPDVKQEEKKVADKFNAAHYSTGTVAASFTSTAMVPETRHEAAIIEEDLVRYERVKKKGYVRLVTNFGPLNLELDCDMVPRACENFIKLCEKGYYDNTKFHRSIRNFMIQGGDPTGTGEGGQSIWGKPFEDEFKPNLTHTGRGVLSMANSGPNTNKSQFFLTYRSCRHLDNKHSVFGRVVGGLDTLSAMEKIEVDNKDLPIEDIVIEKAQVFVDPYTEADEQLVAERAEELTKRAAEAAAEATPRVRVVPNQPLKAFHSGVGKYINPQTLNRNHNQVRAKQKMLGNDWNYDQLKNVQLLDRRICPDPETPELSDVEKYEIVLDILNPNLIDLYREIHRVCPEFSSKKSFHLYWKNSSSKILPISNYITYLSMMSTIANENRDLYLVAREWSDTWRRDIATTYTAVPEDMVLVNMIAPGLSAYTAAQERWLSIAKSAATIEFTRTYNPPRPKLSESKTQESKPKGKPGKKKK